MENGNVKKNREAKEAKQTDALAQQQKELEGRLAKAQAAAAVAGVDVSDLVPGAGPTALSVPTVPAAAAAEGGSGSGGGSGGGAAAAAKARADMVAVAEEWAALEAQETTLEAK